MPDKTSENNEPQAPQPRRRPTIVKIARAVAIAVIALLLLIIAAAGAAVWILTPDRLTPLVNRLATEQLNADVGARRVELTFWSTFPRLVVEVDSLVVVSHSLRDIDAATRAQLPAGADSLLSLGSLRGGIDLVALMGAKIRLCNVELRRPRLNIVQVDSLRNNYDIFPASEPSESASKMPDIAIDRFAILDGFPATFTSLADSIRVEAMLSSGSVESGRQAAYTLSIKGDGGGKMSSFVLPPTPFGINGEIIWEASSPGAIRADGLTLSADKVALTVDAAMQMAGEAMVSSLRIAGRDIGIADVINLIPDHYRGELSEIRTDLRASLSAEITEPYLLTSRRLPKVDLSLNVPGGSLCWGHLRLSGLRAEMKGTVDPNNADLSRLEIKEFTTKGDAIDLTLTATVRNPVSDPLIEGHFSGNMAFDRLPEVLTSKLPLKLSGHLSGDADFRLRRSHLSPKGFHKMRIDGDLRLRDFRASTPDGLSELYIGTAGFRLGTRNSVTVNGVAVDSLLTASLDIDTIAAGIPGIGFSASGISMGVGSRNVSSSSDTTRINPLGGTIRTRLLMLRTDSDSIRMRLNDALIKATLQRYNNEARAPLLKLGLEMGALRIADKYNHFSLRDASAELMLHPKARPRMSKRFQAVYDSVAAQYPHLSSDSIMHLALRARFGTRMERTDRGKSERIDFEIDNSLKSWLRLWQVEGSIKARRARVFTPYFPVRNRVSNLDLAFSTDSITVTDTRYRMGSSDFLINGKIRNIARALTSQRGAPLSITLDIASDSLDINDITHALMAGASFSQRVAKGKASMSHSDNDDAIAESIESQIDSTDRAAVLIPTNIKADISMRAANMKYGDIKFQRFTGEITARNGAVQLNRLGAFTPMGSFGMTALYSAPTVDDIRFAGGIVIRRLDLKEFLSMIPEIDTIIPMLKSMEGIITAECAMTTKLDSMMNLEMHTLDMALKLTGDSLVLLDSETFRKISKWLLFKNKKRNMIDSMSVELAVRDNRLQLYPFMVSLDRYRFGISGSNDAALNLDYHIAVLKSPVPFKFGINIKGTPEHLKIRLGGARFNEHQVASSRNLTDTVRINLVREIQNFFRFGVRNGRNVRLTRREPKPTPSEFLVADTISHADSTFFIRQGVIPKPAGWVDPDSAATAAPKKKKKFFGIF